jgi:hypothetical protein
VDEHRKLDETSIQQFRVHPVHRLLKTLSGMRPSVDISVQ